jgi:hypothetical protein
MIRWVEFRVAIQKKATPKNKYYPLAHALAGPGHGDRPTIPDHVDMTLGEDDVPVAGLTLQHQGRSRLEPHRGHRDGDALEGVERQRLEQPDGPEDVDLVVAEDGVALQARDDGPRGGGEDRQDRCGSRRSC